MAGPRCSSSIRAACVCDRPQPSCLTGKGEQSEGMLPPTGRGAGDRPHQTCWDIFIIPPGVYSFQAEFVNKFNPEKTIIV